MLQQAAVLAAVHCQRRLDNSTELAAEARYAFAAGLAKGEAGLQLARQALLIAAEDDAIGMTPALTCLLHVAHVLATVPAGHAEQAHSSPPCSTT